MAATTADATAANQGYANTHNGGGFGHGNGAGYGGGPGFNEKSYGHGGYGNNYGYHRTMMPADGFGPRSDDPVSYQRYFTKIANPGPLGLYAFAFSTFLWSFYLVHTRGIQTANIMVAVGLFVGGLVQFLAGMWEFPRGNVFGATVFSMYAAFYFSYAIIIWPATAVRTSFGSQSEFNNAVGLYYMVWAIITFLFFFTVLRRNISFISMFFFWFLTYLFLAVSQWTTRHSSGLSVAGGAFGFVTSVIALYIATSQLIRSESAWGFRMPLGHIGERAGSRAGGPGMGAGAGNGAGTAGAAGRV